MDGRLRQQQIYLDGVSGRRPGVSTDLSRLEAEAEKVMRPEAFAYIAGGAGAGATMRANRAAFGRHRIVPRMLRDVIARDTSVELFGRRWPRRSCSRRSACSRWPTRTRTSPSRAPRRRRACRWSSRTRRRCRWSRAPRRWATSPRWFQLYWSRRTSSSRASSRAPRRCGCEAIVVTLDTTLLGWRTRDLDLGYLPFLRGRGSRSTPATRCSSGWWRSGSAAPRTVDAARPRPTLSALSTLFSG